MNSNVSRYFLLLCTKR